MPGSPSSEKVDRFLSEVSELSRERQRDYLKRNSRKRDIDFGLLDYQARTLTFKRDEFREKWGKAQPDESAPPLPERPVTPPLPKRPETPPTPARPVDIEIVKPVARPEKPQKYTMPLYVARKETATEKPFSFLDLERKIKAGSSVTMQVKAPKPVSPPGLKPVKPPKPGSKPGSLNLAKVDVFENAGSTAKEPTRVEANGKPPVAPKPTSFRTSEPTKPPKPAKLSPKPAKLSPKPSKPSRPMSELEEHIGRLSPVKTQTPKGLKQYEEGQESILKDRLAALGKPKPPAKPRRLHDEPEALQALSKLKAKPPRPKTHVSTTQTVEPKSRVAATETLDTNLATSNPFLQLDIRNQLSSILRSSTEPAVGASRPELKKSSTDPETKKLTHPTKSRSRGPKRRLPNRNTNTSKTNSPLLNSRESANVFETSAHDGVSVAHDTAPASLADNAKSEALKNAIALKKARGPVKPPKPAQLVKARAISGELFL